MIASGEYLSSFEISDLTVDCNLQNTPFDTSPVIAGPGLVSLTQGQALVTTSAGFFDAGMLNKIAYFYKDEPHPVADVIFSGQIIGVSQEGPGADSSLKGINVQYCDELIAENNIISNIVDEEAVRFSNCVSRKFFNNQNQAGKLLRGYDGSKYVLELEDAVQDVLLPI